MNALEISKYIIAYSEQIGKSVNNIKREGDCYNMARIYALYKGEELLADGTIAEIAKKMNVKEDTIRFYGRPVYNRRCKRPNTRQLVFLGEE